MLAHSEFSWQFRRSLFPLKNHCKQSSSTTLSGLPCGSLGCQAWEIGVCSGYSQNITIQAFSSKCDPAYFQVTRFIWKSLYRLLQMVLRFFVMIFDVKEFKFYVHCQICWVFMMQVIYGLYWRWRFMEAKIYAIRYFSIFLFNFYRKKITEVIWTVDKSFMMIWLSCDFPVISFTVTAFFCLLGCSFIELILFSRSSNDYRHTFPIKILCYSVKNKILPPPPPPSLF